jgi:hypothetical protein
MTSTRLDRGADAAAMFLLAASASTAAQQATGSSHASALSAPRVDTLGDGRVVISLIASGDLRGLLTLTLHPTAGSSYTGEWAFTVAHVDNSDPATGLEPAPEGPEGDTSADHPHKDFVRLVQRGSLSGTVGDAVLVRDASGALSGLAATLSVCLGTMEFNGAAGSGNASLTDLTLVF